jgi:hypothetical protein
MRCKVCGRPANSLAGGNSFRDVLELVNNAGNTNTAGQGQASGLPQLNKISKDIKDIKNAVFSKKYTSIPALVIVCIFAVLISTIVVAAIEMHSFSSLKGENTMQFQKLNQIISELNNTVNEESDVVYIDKNPDSEYGFIPGQTSIAFICSASGSNLNFSWIKYNVETNQWDEITDGDLFEIDNQDNESRLTVINAASVNEGTYICIVKDASGQAIYSAPAQLAFSGTISAAQTATAGNAESLADGENG